MTEEDEAFNDIERQAKQRKEAVKAALEPYLEVYKNPPQRTWVGLTDEEENEYNYLGPDMRWVIQEISAKLKEKNT